MKSQLGINSNANGWFQTSLLKSTRVGLLDIHPTLYVVSSWWNRLDYVLFGPWRTGLALPWTRSRDGPLSENPTLVFKRKDLWLICSFLQESVPISGQFGVILIPLLLPDRRLGHQHARERVALERRERVRQPESQFRNFSNHIISKNVYTKNYHSLIRLVEILLKNVLRAGQRRKMHIEILKWDLKDWVKVAWVSGNAKLRPFAGSRLHWSAKNLDVCGETYMLSESDNEVLYLFGFIVK